MRIIRKLLSTMLALVLFTLCFSLAQASSMTGSYQLGDQIDDFTITTYDGQTITLSEVLAEKDMVLINLWATWCGPCRNEFPYMEEAYKQYQDQVEIIALSCEATDTDDVLASFVAEMGMTFKVGRDTADLASRFNVSSIPTTIVVDRYGTICFWEAGAMTDVVSFTSLFDAFVGDDYTESLILDGLPPTKPEIAASSEAELSEALGAAATNSGNAYTWPMVVTQKDGRTVVASTNGSHDSTAAEVTATVSAKAGDAIVITFKTSVEPVFDLLNIAVNGEVVKVFSGEHDWMTYAVPVEADGSYEVTLRYEKDVISAAGEDAVWIDSVAVAIGEDAAAAIEANPAYPIADETALIVTNPDAKEIIMTDESGMLYSSFGDARYYIINDDMVTFNVTLTTDVDPEAAVVYRYYDLTTAGLMENMTESGYSITTGVDTMDTTGYPYTYAVLYFDATASDYVMTVYFRDEENLNTFVSDYQLGTWKYADTAAEDAAPTIEAALNDTATYVLKCVDQDGNPVPGVMLQICDDSTCMVYTSDENGLYTFTGAAYAWEIHILRAPTGYTADTAEAVVAPAAGGEITLTLTRNEAP